MKIIRLLRYLLVIVLGAALFLGVYFGSEDNPKPCELTVMSYNIRCITFSSDPVDMWSNRKDAFIQHINNNDPDIIGMQEVTVIQNEFLDDALPLYDKVSHNRDVWINSAASPIFYKRDMFELIDSGTFWISQTPDVMSRGWDADMFRNCSWATLKHHASKKSITVFNTHLDHKGVISRQEGILLIIERASAVDMPVIITGDFNFNETNPNYTAIANAFHDTKYIAETSMSAGTFHGYNIFDTTHLSPIDFIFVSKDHFEVSSYQVLMEKVNDVFTSDHYAVKSVMTVL